MIPAPSEGFALAIRPGAMIGGKYQVQRIIGRGGMGLVLSANHVELAQEVAIKLLLPEAASDAEGVARFLREGKASARFTSPHITKVFDVGRLDSGEPFLVMEFLRGRDLKNIVDRHGPQPSEVVIGWLLEAAEGLAEAHALGIVHRDIKPGNLFLAETAGGRHIIKILDFGISKQMHAGEADLTRTSSTMGSPRYMAPEQMKSPKGVDHRVDIWGLGTILYELTTGQPPFLGQSLTEVVVEVLHKEPAPPITLQPRVSPGLNAVILRCLAKDPAARIQTAADLARALRAVLAGNHDPMLGLTGNAGLTRDRKMAPSLIDSVKRGPSSGEAASATMRTWDTTAQGGQSGGRGMRVSVLAACAAIIGVAVGGGLYVWNEGKVRTATATSTATSTSTSTATSTSTSTATSTSTSTATSTSSAPTPLVEPLESASSSAGPRTVGVPTAHPVGRPSATGAHTSAPVAATARPSMY